MTRRLPALAAALAALAASPPAAADPGATEGLLFVSARDGDAEIYLRQADGGELQLTRNRVDDRLPAWSPDRTRIAFVRDRQRRGFVVSDIYGMRADGTDVRRLTGGPRPGGGTRNLYPAWSPDGRTIAFASERDGGEAELYLMRADGSRQRRLTRTGRAVMDVHPAFSPDGRFLVFASNRISYFNLELFRIRVADGKGLRRLTFWGSGEDGAPGDDAMPTYAPDGSRIAFVSDRSGTLQAWTIAPDGSDPRQLTHARAAAVFFPRWSPDGTRLAYAAETARGSAIHVVDPDGTDTAVGEGREPAW